MKTKSKLSVSLYSIATACIIFSLLVVASCKKDDESPTPVKISLSTSSSQISESSDKGVTITAQLEKPSPVNGSVIIELTGSADYGKDYTTQPGANSKRVTISFSKGDTKKSITIRPKDNNQTDGDKKVILELVKLPNGIKFSDDKIVTITITDDDKPAEKIKVDLEATANSVPENSTEGIVIKAILSKAMDTEVSIEVTLSGDAQYDTDYVTNPKANGKIVTLNFAKGKKEQLITLKPKDNAEREANKKVILTLTKVTKGVEIGSEKTLELTIIDDESKHVANQVSITASPNKILENSESEVIITVQFTKATTIDGWVMLDANGTTARIDVHFNTVPKIPNNDANGMINLPVRKGIEKYKISVKPIDNDDKDGTRTIKLKLTKASSGIEIGDKKEIAIDIIDDDQSTDNTNTKKNILGTWKVKSGTITIWTWKDGKPSAKSSSKFPSSMLNGKFIFTNTKITIHSGDGADPTQYENYTVINKAIKILSNIIFNIKNLDGRNMTLESPKPTKKSDFNQVNGKLEDYYQFTYFVVKQ